MKFMQPQSQSSMKRIYLKVCTNKSQYYSTAYDWIRKNLTVKFKQERLLQIKAF